MLARSLVVAGLALAAGCQGLPKMPDLNEVTPKVRFQDLKVDDLDFHGLDGRFVLRVDNPYPVKLDVARSSWKLGIAGHPLLDGTNEHGTTIGASGRSTVGIPFSMAFADALRVAADAAKGKDSVPYRLDVDLAFQTPIGPVGVPFHHEGELPALRAPKVRLQALRVADLDLVRHKASLALDLGVHSDQPSALSIGKLDWGLKLAGHEVATGRTRIGPIDGDRTVTLPVDVDLLSVGETVVDAITKKGPVRATLTADADVDTPFGAVPLKVDESTELTPR